MGSSVASDVMMSLTRKYEQRLCLVVKEGPPSIGQGAIPKDLAEKQIVMAIRPYLPLLGGLPKPTLARMV